MAQQSIYKRNIDKMQKQNVTNSRVIISDKCTKHHFIHLLTTTCNDWHKENSKNHKNV